MELSGGQGWIRTIVPFREQISCVLIEAVKYSFKDGLFIIITNDLIA